MSGKCLKRYKNPAQGQGVVEYAGALVIAALIVAAGITILPPNLATFVQNIQVSMMNFLVSQLST